MNEQEQAKAVIAMQEKIDELEAENKVMEYALLQIGSSQQNRRRAGIGYDPIIDDIALSALQSISYKPKAKACLMPIEMKSHWFEHCDSDKPTANCLCCENWKGFGATFLPKCKWQFPEDGVVYCRKTVGGQTYGEHYGSPCTKRCTAPEPEVD
jgi:hypothetical protein